MCDHQHCNVSLLCHPEQVAQNSLLRFVVDLSCRLVEQDDRAVFLEERMSQVEQLLLASREVVCQLVQVPIGMPLQSRLAQASRRIHIVRQAQEG